MITDRLKQLIDYLGITPNAFASRIGVSQPRMRNYLEGRMPDFETLKRICETFVMINPGWLLTGTGDMIIEQHLKNNKSNSKLSTQRIDELTEIITIQAKALLEQQQFINAHFPKSMRGQIITPPLGNMEKSPDTEHIKE